MTREGSLIEGCLAAVVQQAGSQPREDHDEDVVFNSNDGHAYRSDDDEIDRYMQ